MAQWGEWFQRVGAGMVDGGDGLLPTGKIVAPGGVVTDGPFIEAKELVGGFNRVIIVQVRLSTGGGHPSVNHGLPRMDTDERKTEERQQVASVLEAE